MGLSVVVALVLTPALCATLLKPVGKGHGLTRRGPFGWFNRGFDAFSGWYQGGVRRSGSRLGRYGVVYLAIVGGLVWLRSEEHTSELQSLMRISYAVFCLKKKN